MAIYVKESNSAVALTDNGTVVTPLASGTDLNTITNAGVYSSTSSANSYTNLPPNFQASSFRLIVTSYNTSGNQLQILIPFTSKRVSMRTHLSAGWEDWITSSFVPDEYLYIDCRSSNIDAKLLEVFQAMPMRTSTTLTLRTIDSTDSDHILDSNVWEIHIWKPSTAYGTFDATTYNAPQHHYRANYINNSLSSWTDDFASLETKVNTIISGTQTFSGTKTFSSQVNFSKRSDLTGDSSNTDPVITIGPTSGEHLELDGNEIHAKSNASTTSRLVLNADGGNVEVGNNSYDVQLVVGPKAKFEYPTDNRTYFRIDGPSSGFAVKSYDDPDVFKPCTASKFNEISSVLVKENIQDLPDEQALKILQLRPVTFDFIEKVGGDKDQAGFIAEEAVNVLPNTVTIPNGFDPDDFNVTDDMPPSIDYSKYVPYIVKLIQMMYKSIQELLRTTETK